MEERIDSWKDRIEEEMKQQQDAWENIEYAMPSIDDKLQGQGAGPYINVSSEFYTQEAQEKPFLVYTKGWIYFCVVYDGGHWVGSVPRNPIRRFTPEMFGC